MEKVSTQELQIAGREALPCSHASLHNFDIAQDSGRIIAPCFCRCFNIAPNVLNFNAST